MNDNDGGLPCPIQRIVELLISAKLMDPDSQSRLTPLGLQALETMRDAAHYWEQTPPADTGPTYRCSVCLDDHTMIDKRWGNDHLSREAKANIPLIDIDDIYVDDVTSELPILRCVVWPDDFAARLTISACRVIVAALSAAIACSAVAQEDQDNTIVVEA